MSHDFGGEGVVPGEYFLVSTKLDTFCYLTVQTAYPTFSPFDTIPACDRRTDGRNCYSWYSPCNARIAARRKKLCLKMGVVLQRACNEGIIKIHVSDSITGISYSS